MMEAEQGCWIVTGASSGIGRAAALELARDEAALVLSGRDVPRLDEVAFTAREAGARDVVTVSGDVADPGLRRDLVERGAALGCRGLVNAAGFSTGRDHVDLEASDVADQLAVNVRALTALTHAVARSFVAQRHGYILNVSSLAGWQGIPTQAVYAATKAYVTSFSRALHAELRRDGVHVTALCPGLVETAFFDSAGIDLERRFAKLGQWDSPKEVARAGLAAVRRGRLTVIPGRRNRVSPFLQRFMPREWIAAASRRVMERTP